MNQTPDPTAHSSKQKRKRLAQLLRQRGKGFKTFPLSFAQERLWFLGKLVPDDPVYNIPTAFHLSGPLEVAVLMQSLHEIVRRHEVLRTHFVSVEGQPLQLVAPSPQLKLPVVDLCLLPPAKQETQLSTLIQQEASRCFDLGRGPLLRLTLLRLGEEEHVVLFTMHHIISDGWSMELFVEEMAVLYQSFLAGESSPLPDLPVQYGDFAVWQRKWMQSEGLQEQLAYWKQQLAGLPPALELPVCRPRPPMQTFAGASYAFELSISLTRALKALSREENATLFMTLLAVFKILLYRYTARKDVVVGSPVANRNRSEVERLIGFFVNMLVLRTDFSGDLTFRQLLAQIRKSTLEALAHQDIPFEKLVEVLRPQRDMRHSALFQVAFTLQNVTAPAKFSALTITPLPIEEKTAKFDLILSLEESAHNLKGSFIYNTDLFTAGTVVRMAGHLQTLLAAVVAAPNQHISTLPLLRPAEREQLLEGWNDTRKDYAEELLFPDLVATQVREMADAIAVVFEDEQLTYQELNGRSNQLAHYLRELGVGPEGRVGIFLDRSLEMIVALLAVLKAGGAYVPFDPLYPQERLAFMCANAKITVLLTRQSLLPELPSFSGHPVCLDTDWKAIEKQSSANPAVSILPGNLAYVIYTSGSTGEPKGVAVAHRQLLNYLYGILDRLHVFTAASFATVSTIAADLGNTMIFPALASGGCLHVVAQERVSDAPAAADYFETRFVDYLKIVPSHLAALQSVSRPERLLPRRMLVLGGEAASTEWVETLRVLNTPCTILNHYGPTETTVGVLTYRVGQEEDALDAPTLPLGRPLANTQSYVLDAHLQPVPVGVPGELYIGGRSVTRGYLERPGLTAERFIPNPFLNDEREESDSFLLYKTGDLVRYRADGSIEFLGRVDDQVKVRGYRVEPGEVEAVLCQHPDLQTAVVLARGTTPQARDKQLVAYVVPNQEKGLTMNGYRRYRLPNNMAIAQLNKNETDYMYREIFELQAYLRHGITLNEGACVFDVGANIGLFTLLVHQLCPDSAVYAFEPNPVVFDLLSANTTLYGANTRLFNCGLSGEAGEATFMSYPGFSLLSGFYADAETDKEVVKTFMTNLYQAGQDEMAALIAEADDILEERFKTQTFETKVETLSAIIEREKVARIDLLKINVEKSELDVLRGIRREDWAKIRQIVMEVDVEENVDAILSLLKNQGYQRVVEQDRLLEDTSLYYIYAIQSGAENKIIKGQAPQAHLRPLPLLDDPLLRKRNLREFLQKKVPDYMIPAAFVMLETLPLTANGKVDRQALPAAGAGDGGREGVYIPPRDPLELQLAQIWKALLGVESVGVRDNFFDRGGHSLMVVRLSARIEQLSGARLPVTTLFQKPTIEEVAILLRRQGKHAPDSPLVEIQRGQSGPSFFCVHPAGGDVFCYFDLAAHLGTERPFYGLQAAGLYGQRPPLATVEEMAAYYVEAICEAQPTGPYLIGGWSTGGVVAFEMAQRLRSQGQRVALLALLDPTPLHVAEGGEKERKNLLIKSFIWNLGFPAKAGFTFSIESLLQLEVEDQLKALLEEAKKKHVVPPDIDQAHIHRLFRVFKANVEAVGHYSPQRYPGRITLFRASEHFAGNGLGPGMDWSEFTTQPVAQKVVPGNHYTILKVPYVKALAEQLRDAIQTATASES